MRHDSKQLKEMANAVKANALAAVRNAASGHVGIVLGASDVITTIYAEHLRFDMDEFVLSAGHGSAMLYAVLKLTGYKIPELNTFRKFGGLSGHPEYETDGVNATTGPLGQGVANAVGIALALKKQGNGRVYCLCSDGDLMEGVAQEAIAFCGHYKLNNFILLWDDNKISIDGAAVMESDIPERMHAAGFTVLHANGDNFEEIHRALVTAKKSAKPVFIRCKTIIGAGSSVAGTARAHAYGLSESELVELEQKFGTPAGEKLWSQVAAQPKRQKQIAKIEISPEFISSIESISTRELSGMFLERVVRAQPLILGGSADLAGSTNTKTNNHRDVTPDDLSGNFINYGVREHAMAGIMNGLTMSGFRPYGGTFLVFSDYMRPSIRLAAFSKIPTIFVFSHDSIAVGEDGPTHQPIEQTASLRLIPNINVFRPCNASEIGFAWATALSETTKPSCIILSRQKFKQIATPDVDDIKRGGYIIRSSGYSKTKYTIIATGSEVPLAVQVADILQNASVVSMPSVEIFRAQPDSYKNKILQGNVIVIEAGATRSWFEFADAVVGIDEFGISGPGAQVYQHFGFDAEKIAQAVVKGIKSTR